MGTRVHNSTRGTILVFSAASGAGKTTILNYLRNAIPGLAYSISATTRKPRAHERDGVDYFFLSEDDFRRKIADNAFAEWAEVHGNLYGTPKAFIDETISAGRHLVMDIDVYGKLIFDKSYPEAIGIFIEPPSLEELEKRLRARNTDAEDVIALRLRNAKKEMAVAREKGRYDYTIINDDLKRAEREAEQLVRKLLDAHNV
jgi:guanylate kinase